MKFVKIYVNLATCLSILAVSACSTNNADEALLSSDDLYQQAVNAYEEKKYTDAVENFQRLEKEYPFSRYTKDGLVKTAFAQYTTYQYIQATQTLKRYLEIYPGADNSDYVIYLLAMCYYNQIIDPRRDHDISLTAKKYLTELTTRYPNSEHSIDGKIKLDFVNNQIAAKEMIIGRFYLNNEQYPAAINRFKYVVKNHQTTIHIKEALHRLVEAYLMLGLIKPAYQTAALLGYNYPESKWYHASYELMQQSNSNYKVDLPKDKEEADRWWHHLFHLVK